MRAWQGYHVYIFDDVLHALHSSHTTRFIDVAVMTHGFFVERVAARCSQIFLQSCHDQNLEHQVLLCFDFFALVSMMHRCLDVLTTSSSLKCTEVSGATAAETRTAFELI